MRAFNLKNLPPEPFATLMPRAMCARQTKAFWQGLVMAADEMTLCGTLRLADAEPLRAGLATALAAGDLTVRMDQVETVDAAILQVLISACRTAQKLERRLQLEFPIIGDVALLAGQLGLLPLLAHAGAAVDLKGYEA